MWTPTIGENAGKVWQTLSEHGSMSLTAIRKATGLDDKSMYLSLGWLSREDKIVIEQKKGATTVSLSGK